MANNQWNPWHGCHRISAGCKNCYVYFQDKCYERDASIVTKSKTNFDMPLKKDRYGNYKVKSGEEIASCFTSDFFIAEADEWRRDVWSIIRLRRDVNFFIITKRIARFMACIPEDWNEGWDNVIISATTENQQMLDERAPILLEAPIKTKGLIIAPILESVHLEQYIEKGKIDFVTVGGESYENARECNFDWVVDIKRQCEKHNVRFYFHQTGSNFIYKGKHYKIPHHLEYEQARKAFFNKNSKGNF